MRWGVFKLFDSGRMELVTPASSEHRASELAGVLRDRMTDAQVAEAMRERWNYGERILRREDMGRQRKRLVRKEVGART